MNRRNDIEVEWIAAAPGLAGSGFMPAPYRVPDGYFEGFFHQLMVRLNSAAAEIEEISPLLAGLSRSTPYQVPDNYFTQFRVSDEKLQLANVSVQDAGAEVPETSISGVQNPVISAPVITMNWKRTWARLAVAAAVTGLIATSAFFYFRPSQTSVPGELSKISDQDMMNYMMSEDLPVESAGDSAVSAPNLAARQPFNDNEISDLMSNVSDNELEDYASNDGPDSNLN